VSSKTMDGEATDVVLTAVMTAQWRTERFSRSAQGSYNFVLLASEFGFDERWLTAPRAVREADLASASATAFRRATGQVAADWLARLFPSVRRACLTHTRSTL
jgi:hypothetical protein